MADSEIDPDVPLRPLTPFQQGMIAFASVAMGAGMTINFVVVAPLARQAGLTEIQVAGILTLSAAIYALMIPQWGRWADRFGRKRVMVFSLLSNVPLKSQTSRSVSAAAPPRCTMRNQFTTPKRNRPAM